MVIKNIVLQLTGDRNRSVLFRKLNEQRIRNLEFMITCGIDCFCHYLIVAFRHFKWRHVIHRYTIERPVRERDISFAIC